MTKDIAKLPPFERLMHWIIHRHAIYLKKEAGEQKPWTDDAALRDYFFTCPYRENDKTTVWFRDNIREKLRDDPKVILATVIFRWFNLIETGELLLSEGLLPFWDRKIAFEVLSAVEGKVFTGAYVVNACRGKNVAYRTKVDVVCERIDNVWRDRYSLRRDLEECNTLQSAFNRLSVYPGLKGTGFCAYEIVSDLRHTCLLEDATDLMTWCNPGPGCMRGLRNVLDIPSPSYHHKVLKDWQPEMIALLKKINNELPKDMPRFEMRELEHSLCEFSKYERARTGEGYIKRRYVGA